MKLKLIYQALAASCAILGSTNALAEARASAYIGDERVPYTIPDPVSGPLTATQQQGELGGSHFAFASADAGTGQLKATSKAGLVGPYLLPADASASISEILTFSGGYGSTAYLDWSFEGQITLAGAPNPQAAFSQFQIYTANVISGSSIEYHTLTPFAAACGPGCEVGTSIMKTGTVAIPINEYGVTVSSSLLTFASYGNLVDFGNTSKLYLRLPDGVTYTSSSGQFLANALPIPEPSTSILMLIGVATGAACRRKIRDA